MTALLLQPQPHLQHHLHTSQMWLKSSSPRTASALRYSGVKITSPRRLSTSPLWRGMPNLVGNAVWMWAMTFRVIASVEAFSMIISSCRRPQGTAVPEPIGRIFETKPTCQGLPWQRSWHCGAMTERFINLCRNRPPCPRSGSPPAGSLHRSWAGRRRKY